MPLCVCDYVHIVLAGQLCGKYHHHIMGVCLSLLIWKCFAVICPTQSTPWHWHNNRNIPSHATMYDNLKGYNYVILFCKFMQANGFILSTLFQGSAFIGTFAFRSFDPILCNGSLQLFSVKLKISSALIETVRWTET